MSTCVHTRHACLSARTDDAHAPSPVQHPSRPSTHTGTPLKPHVQQLGTGRHWAGAPRLPTSLLLRSHSTKRSATTATARDLRAQRPALPASRLPHHPWTAPWLHPAASGSPASGQPACLGLPTPLHTPLAHPPSAATHLRSMAQRLTHACTSSASCSGQQQCTPAARA